VALKDIKHSYPVQVADYAIANKIDDEPAFAWWVPHVFKKRDRILSKIKSKYWEHTHKFGIKIPKDCCTSAGDWQRKWGYPLVGLNCNGDEKRETSF
jgi:hypothetical protein